MLQSRVVCWDAMRPWHPGRRAKSGGFGGFAFGTGIGLSRPVHPWRYLGTYVKPSPEYCVTPISNVRGADDAGISVLSKST
jgi:hypothetical protein